MWSPWGPGWGSRKENDGSCRYTWESTMQTSLPRSQKQSSLSLLSLLVLIPTGFGRCIHFLVMSSSHHTCIEFLSSPGTGANSASLNDPLIGCLPPALWSFTLSHPLANCIPGQGRRDHRENARLQGSAVCICLIHWRLALQCMKQNKCHGR